MDLTSLSPLPNSRDHPEVINWMKNLSDAQRNLVSLNTRDPSNFLDEAHKQETIQRLKDNVIEASRELETWCNHYGISYGKLDLPR